mgnify:CR=1 FL=1
MALSIDLTGISKREVGICIVFLRDPVLFAKLHSFVSSYISEKKIHHRELSKKKKKKLYEALNEVFNKYGGKELFVWFITIHLSREANRIAKLRWLSDRIIKIIVSLSRLYSISKITLGSDLEMRKFSLFRKVVRKIGSDKITVNDSSKDVQIADVIANYVRVLKPDFPFVYYEKHFC